MKLLNKLVNRLSDAKMQSKLYTSGKCKAAFTLAEVLITLAVIGVVAAMTMPILINKINDRVAATKLKKTQAILEEAYLRMVADKKPTSIEEYRSALYFHNLNKYLKVISKNGNDIVLSDGTTLRAEIEHLNGLLILVDINGNSGQNKMCHDQFYFVVGREDLTNTLVHPFGTPASFIALTSGSKNKFPIFQDEAVAIYDDISRAFNYDNETGNFDYSKDSLNCAAKLLGDNAVTIDELRQMNFGE